MNEQQTSTNNQKIITGNIQFPKTSPDKPKDVQNSEASPDKPKRQKKDPSKPKKTTSQRLAELEAERAKLIEKKRKEDTHKLIVLGGIFKNIIKHNSKFSLFHDLPMNAKNWGITEKDIEIYKEVLSEILSK